MLGAPVQGAGRMPWLPIGTEPACIRLGLQDKIPFV
mgnify:CR=1 FL=1